MPDTDGMIAHWQHILDGNIHGPNHATAKDRLRAYVCSLMMGRDFLEPCDAYIDRAGYRDFYTWAMGMVNP